MKRTPRIALETTIAALALLGAPGLAGAQIISLKTVPVAAGDQFLVFPAHNLGMGGVSIALADEWLDPYINPSLGARLSGSRVFGSPLFCGISNTNSAARTLPISAMLGSPTWFGGGSLAVQQLDTGNDVFGGRGLACRGRVRHGEPPVPAGEATGARQRRGDPWSKPFPGISLAGMTLRIVRSPITRSELAAAAAEQFGDFLKVVVDVGRGVMAIGGELHSDEEAALLEDGARQQDLWDINLYPAEQADALIEFDSVINIRPSQGNRSRAVDDQDVRRAIREVVNTLVAG
jgi:hypothetical protein